MPEVLSPQIAHAAGQLESLLCLVHADARQEKALYHLERLRLAVTASHQEGVRFAAFTLDKTVRDAAADWGADVTGAMQTLREALRAAGHQY